MLSIICIIITLYRKGLNHLGWTILLNKSESKYGKSIIIPNNYEELEYCEINNGEYAPEICNEFAADLLQ